MMKGNNTIKTIAKRPVFAGIAAALLIGAPVAGFGLSGMLSNAAETSTDDELLATYILPTSDEDATVAKESMDLTDTLEVTEIETKTIAFDTEGAGHIEPNENCTIDGDGKTITILDASKEYSFKLVTDSDEVEYVATVGGIEVEDEDGIVTVFPENSDGEVYVAYTDPEAEAAAAAAEEAAKAAAATTATTTSTSKSTSSSASTSNTNSSTASKTSTTTTSSTTTKSTSTSTSTSTSSSSSTATPASGQSAHSMTSEELALAKEIFNAYNSYRASKGLSTVTWSEDCANMAYASAKGCAAAGTLTHRLGIPSAVQGNYSDILQYSTWKMNASDTVNNWINSSGHRKMMQCSTTTVAGVGVYNNNGVWYYVIVYNFSGTNQSGS